MINDPPPEQWSKSNYEKSISNADMCQKIGEGVGKAMGKYLLIFSVISFLIGLFFGSFL